MTTEKSFHFIDDINKRPVYSFFAEKNNNNLQTKKDRENFLNQCSDYCEYLAKYKLIKGRDIGNNYSHDINLISFPEHKLIVQYVMQSEPLKAHKMQEDILQKAQQGFDMKTALKSFEKLLNQSQLNHCNIQDTFEHKKDKDLNSNKQSIQNEECISIDVTNFNDDQTKKKKQSVANANLIKIHHLEPKQQIVHNEQPFYF